MKTRLLALGTGLALAALIAIPAAPATADINHEVHATVFSSVALNWVDGDWHGTVINYPKDIQGGSSNGGETTFDMANADGSNVWGWAKANILTSGRASAYYAEFYAGQQANGTKASCKIFLGDPSEEGAVQKDFSPFLCKARVTGPGSMLFTLDYGKFKVATEKDTKLHLLDTICATGKAPDDCVYLPTSSVASSRRGVPYGTAVDNPSDETQAFSVKDEVTTSWEYSLKVEINGEADLVSVYKVGFSIAWKGSWGKDTTFRQDYDMEVPPHSRGWLTLNQPTITAKGDFYVREGDTNWIIKNDTAVIPDNTRGVSVTFNSAVLGSGETRS